jgi:hypothetical protein
MAREKGIEVDEEGFNKLMQEQKDRARAAGKFTARSFRTGTGRFYLKEILNLPVMMNLKPKLKSGLHLKRMEGPD